jgi:alpha-L-rhamnosidase
MMVRVGSPFAMQYYYETLEKIGHAELILDSIYAAYLPMLELGSTTVWETFPDGNYNPGEFPTRSHCHAWSAAPLYFLRGCCWASGRQRRAGANLRSALTHWGHHLGKGQRGNGTGGAIRQMAGGSGRLNVNIHAPPGVKVKFMENETVRGLGLMPRVNILGG